MPSDLQSRENYPASVRSPQLSGTFSRTLAESLFHDLGFDLVGLGILVLDRLCRLRIRLGSWHIRSRCLCVWRLRHSVLALLLRHFAQARGERSEEHTSELQSLR